ncbi:Myb-like protein I [Galdieria sulphuraria]|uniref:Myb domain-containing protein n=1 Tax=Galdieria sulphuraria TaxID=130081 RepID=M2XTL6_GALSU|nr:myb domain-containing protein [Galdieria sulphuraria]EME26754.1 myb domain-containing protein [Galdieria sulphuraria]GJD07027.1 Myb-like protein I [Galdieria sulphuraria]|eukprot:XP_005703274.1 myb domain-containing protein [Galdieria sulphuraria]
MASFNEPGNYRNPSTLQKLSRNNSFYNNTDSGGEQLENRREGEGLENSPCVPVSDIVIEKLRQHVKQLEAKLQVAYMEIERLKLQSNPNVMKIESNAQEKSDTEGSPVDLPYYAFYSHATPVTVQQDEISTKEVGNLEVKVGGVSNKGTPNSSRTKTSRYWSCEEHSRFLEGLELYGAKDIKAISNYVGTRSSTQVRTHAQKYYLRLARELLRKQSLGNEVGKGKMIDKVDDVERLDADPGGSGSSDFSVDELGYDSLSGLKIPKAALEIAKQEARRLGSKGMGIWKKGSMGKNTDGDSLGCNSYVNSPVFSEGYSGSNVDWDDSENGNLGKVTTSKRSRAVEDVSNCSNVRAKHSSYSMDTHQEQNELDRNEAERSSHSEELTNLKRPFSLSEDLTWHSERDRKGEEGLVFFQDSLVDIEQQRLPTFGQFDEHPVNVVPPKSTNPFFSNALPRLERDEPNFWVFSQHYHAASSHSEAQAFGLYNVSLDDERNMYRSSDSRCSDDVKKVEFNNSNFFFESKLPFPFHSESFSSFQGATEAERIDMEQSFGYTRTPSFPKILSKPFLSASFSSLGELEDTHNLEQTMFGASSAEEIRE